MLNKPEIISVYKDSVSYYEALTDLKRKYEKLLLDYNELSNKYITLSSNYEEISSGYEEIESDVDSLTQQVNNITNDYNNKISEAYEQLLSEVEEYVSNQLESVSAYSTAKMSTSTTFVDCLNEYYNNGVNTILLFSREVPVVGVIEYDGSTISTKITSSLYGGTFSRYELCLNCGADDLPSADCISLTAVDDSVLYYSANFYGKFLMFGLKQFEEE